MALRQAEERLVLLGMEPREARIYAWLATRGPLGAGALARHLDLHRNEVYRLLARMEQAGYTVQSGSPAMHRARPVERVCEALAAQLELQAITVRRLAQELAPLLVPSAPAADQPFLRVVHGRKDIVQDVLELGQRTTRELCALSTREAPFMVFQLLGAEEVLKGLLASGVRIRMLFRKTQPALEALATLKLDARVAVRWTSQTRLTALWVSDGREAFLPYALQDHAVDGKAEAVVHTDAPQLVEWAQWLFDQAWDEAAPQPR